MKLPELIDRLTKRGLHLRWNTEEKCAEVFGPTDMQTPSLLRVLRWHREQIVERLAPKPPPPDRRIVRLDHDGPGAPVVAVLWEGHGAESGEREALDRLRAEHPAYVLGVQWHRGPKHPNHTPGWVQYLVAFPRETKP